MKITFLMPPDDLTGGNRVVAQYAREMIMLGHDVLVINAKHAKPTVREVARMIRQKEWVRLVQRFFPPKGHIAHSGVPSITQSTYGPIRASDVRTSDVVISTWWETAYWMQQLPDDKGHKVHFIQALETWFDSETNDRVRQILKAPNTKIAISKGLKAEIEAELGSLNINVVTNAVDHAVFNAPKRYRGKTPRVGFVYSLTPCKATHRYTKAIALARKVIPALEVVAFGSDLPSQDLPLPGGTTFHYRPDQKEIPRIYASCDAWLFASSYDSFGLPILEAMACRTPVIGVRVGAALELISNDAGILLKAQEDAEIIEEMAEQIITLCTMSNTEWSKLSDRAHHRSKEYRWDLSAQSFICVLQNAIERQ